MEPAYSGVSALDITIEDVEQRHQWLDAYVGKGSLHCFDEGRAIMAQRNESGRVRVYACVRQPEGALSEFEQVALLM